MLRKTHCDLEQHFFAPVVQLDLEQGTSNSQVTGSNPVGCTTFTEVSPSWSKAQDLDSCIRWSESSHLNEIS